MTKFYSGREEKCSEVLDGLEPQSGGGIRIQKRRMTQRYLSLCLSVLVPLVSLSSALASSNWIGQTGNDYFDDPGNWMGGVPDSSSTVTFGRPTSVEFRASGAASQLSIDSSTSFLLNGRTFQANLTTISDGAALMIQGGIASLGSLTADGGLIATGPGTLVTTNGISSSWASDGYVFQFSNGASLQAGRIDVTRALSLQFQSGATGVASALSLKTNQTLTVTGAGSGFSTGSLSGSGLITVSEGASVVVGSGSMDGAHLSTLSIVGAGSSYTSSSDLTIQKSLLLSSETSLTVGNLSLNGASSIRDAVVSALNIQNSSVLEIRGGAIGSSGEYSMFDNLSGGSLVGSFSTNYKLQNAGSVTVSAGDLMAFREASNSNGANMKVVGSMEFLKTFTNDGTVALSGDFRANGGIQNRNAFEISGTANIWGGDFKNDENGSVAVFAQSTANFMDDVINDSVIAVGPGSTVVFHGSYSGGGAITGPGTTVMLGDLRPGHSPGRQTFEGNFVFGDLSSYQVEIAGLTQGGQYDVIDVGGHLTLRGALSISLLDGFTPHLGDLFEILTFGTVEGAFSQFQGFTFGDNLSFEAVWGEHNLVLTVVPEPGIAALLIPGVIGVMVYGRFGRRGTGAV